MSKRGKDVDFFRDSSRLHSEVCRGRGVVPPHRRLSQGPAQLQLSSSPPGATTAEPHSPGCRMRQPRLAGTRCGAQSRGMAKRGEAERGGAGQTGSAPGEKRLKGEKRARERNPGDISLLFMDQHRRRLFPKLGTVAAQPRPTTPVPPPLRDAPPSPDPVPSHSEMRAHFCGLQRAAPAENRHGGQRDRPAATI